jgi:hypothetical protein
MACTGEIQNLQNILTVQNVEAMMLERKTKKPSRNRQVADAFAEKYNGSVIGAILGNKGHLKSQSKEKQGRAGYIVEIENLKIHVYLINVWHRNRKGISINSEQLQQALDDDALILMSHTGIEYVMHSVRWEQWANEDNNYGKHPYFGTVEVFAKTDNFRILDLKKWSLKRYYPD